MIALKRNNTLYQQIANYFETEIREGRLKPGVKLPPTTELSKQFGVNPDTIQQSLRILMDQGLISRAPKRGTFVRDSYHGNTIGIVFGKEIFKDNNLAFFPVYLSELIQYAETRGWKTRIFMTVREGLGDTALYELRKAVDAGELGGVIDFCSSFAAKEYLENVCPIAHANAVVHDHLQLLSLGLDYLLKQGYDTIRIYANSGSKTVYTQTKPELEQMIASYRRKYHLSPESIGYYVMRPLQLYGYAKFKQEWKRGVRPRALLLCNDCIFRGVWYAAMELGIRIPEDLSIITHMNRGREPLTHIPLTTLEVSPFDFARETFDELEARIRGKKRISQRIKAVIREGKTC